MINAAAKRSSTVQQLLTQYTARFAAFAPPADFQDTQVEMAEPADASSPVTNAAALQGKIALIDRVHRPDSADGNAPTFVQQALRVQEAGAVAAIIVNDLQDPPMAEDLYCDPSEEVEKLAIPVLMVGSEVGKSWKKMLSQTLRISVVCSRPAKDMLEAEHTRQDLQALAQWQPNNCMSKCRAAVNRTPKVSVRTPESTLEHSSHRL